MLLPISLLEAVKDERESVEEDLLNLRGREEIEDNEEMEFRVERL